MSSGVRQEAMRDEVDALVAAELAASPSPFVRTLYAAVWLGFLVPTCVDAIATGKLLGAGLLIAFALAYMHAWWVWNNHMSRRALVVLDPSSLARIGVCSLLALAATVVIGQDASWLANYIAVMLIARTPVRFGVTGVLVLLLSNEIASRTLPGWTPNLLISLMIALAAAMAAAMRAGIDRRVSAERQRVDAHRLAIAEERARMARDVHDILGHSLTVVAVKAELVARLLEAAEADQTPAASAASADAARNRALARARAEAEDVTTLAREALADVRRTVEGHREVSLTSELAAARLALDAAGIAAEMPNPNELAQVAPDVQSVFAWAVREAVTNVVRHSRATRCRIRIAAHLLEVEDDGRGGGAPSGGSPYLGVVPGHGLGAPGRGLAGLAQRAEQAGLRIATGRSRLGGFRVALAVDDE